VLVALDGRDMTTVTAGLSREMTRLPERLRKSLTWDRGMELADHRTVTVTTGLDVYFADPRSPWQRGTNENTNRLLRQYLPKGQSMAHLTQDDLDAIAAKLNTRPRKTLDFDTPPIGSPHCCADRLSSPPLFSGTRSPSAAGGSRLPFPSRGRAPLGSGPDLAPGYRVARC
jgi:hypothetical protein